MALNENLLELYPDGSKCNEYIIDLYNAESMTWEEVYWRAKYLYVYGRDTCSNRDLINYFNACFNQGLSVGINQSLYMDARKKQSALYIAEEDYKMASNCIQAVLDITEDIPAEMFLDLTYAEIHTDLLRILKSPIMFFNDIHAADSKKELFERQQDIIKQLLLMAAEAKSKMPNVAMDIESIEREVAVFGLNNSEEYALFRKVLFGETKAIVSPSQQVKSVEKQPIVFERSEEIESKKPQEENKQLRGSEGLLEIVLFPDIQSEKEIEPSIEHKEEVEEIKKSDKRIVETPVDSKPKERIGADIDMKNIETMFAAVMATVTENANQIALLHGKIQAISDSSEAERIKGELEESEAKNRELIAEIETANTQIVEARKQVEISEKSFAEIKKQNAENVSRIVEFQKRIEEQEKEKLNLEQRLNAQNELLEEKKKAEFTEEELLTFAKYERVIIIDTCSFENQPDILDYVSDNEMVRISKTVTDELEYHKKKKNDIEKSKIGQRCLKAIQAACKTLSFCDYDDSYTFLLSESLRIKEGDDIGTENDKKIFSLALRYKIYSNISALIISDDTTMQVMADAEHIDNTTAQEFVSKRRKRISINTSQEKITKEQFLSKKIKCNEYSLSQYEVSILNNNGIITIGDILSKTEEDFKFIKDRKGISYTKRFIAVYSKIKKRIQ